MASRLWLRKAASLWYPDVMIASLDQPPFLRQVPIAGPRRPALAWRPPNAGRKLSKLAQVEITPNIDAPINIGLGTLPVTLGAFIASGVSFLVGAQVKSVRPVARVLGVGLAGFGILNLFFGTSAEAEAQATEDAVSAPEGVDATASDAIPATNEDAFLTLEGRVLSPTEQQEVDISAWGGAVPIRVRISNPSSSPVTFDLVIEHTEDPHPIGEVWSTETFLRITLGAGETRDIDTELKLTQWRAWVDYENIDVQILKRRIHGGGAERLADRFFVVE